MTEPGLDHRGPPADWGVEPPREQRRFDPRLGFRHKVGRFLVVHTSGWGLPFLFFLFTVASTLFVGGWQGIVFWRPELFDPGAPPASLTQWIGRYVFYGAPFSFTILAIIFCHEMGHYWTSRRYRIDTTLPFFIPFPISLVGTLGAFILIKSRFPDRKSLIDVGLAGPFAGFAVVIPALFAGVATSRVSPLVPADVGMSLGEPLLLKLVTSLVWPVQPEGYTLYVSPIALAAWFGLLLTAINLLPVGQLDGGHASYAIFGRHAHTVSKVVFLAMFPMAYFGPSWLIWAALLYFLGIARPHPPTTWDAPSVPASRKLMGALGLVVFVLCVTPEPIVFSWMDVWASLRPLFGI